MVSPARDMLPVAVGVDVPMERGEEKMRHGYEWWETFWKWLLKEGKEANANAPLDIYLDNWLKIKKNEFEKLWREDVDLIEKLEDAPRGGGGGS